jgi:cell division protein FtsN
LCAGFVGVFSLGILLGRGYNLEAHIPHLEKIMPQAGRADQPKIVQNTPRSERGDEHGVHKTEKKADSTQLSGKAAAGHESPQDGPSSTAVRQPNPQDTRNQVMQQGDLAYRDTLKQPWAATQKKDDAERQSGKKEDKSPPKDKKTLPDSTSGHREIFNYVYQIAAYKDASSSDKLAASLRAAGIRARTETPRENGSEWYRTVVDFQGSPDEIDRLRAQLKAQGFSRLLLKSKTPAR